MHEFALPIQSRALTYLLNVPEAEADTFDLGDSADADNWDNDVPANAAAGTVACSTGGTDAYATAGGKYYAADDYILLTPSAQLSALVIEGAIGVTVPV